MRNRTFKKAFIVGGTAATAALCSVGMAFAASAPDGVPDGAYVTPNGEWLSPDSSFGVGDINGWYGANTGQPGEPGQYQGTQEFTVYNADGDKIGTFNALVGYNYGEHGDPHMQMFVNSVDPVAGATVGTGDGELPPVGSVFDYGNSASNPSWVYSSLAGYDVHDPNAIAGHGDVVSSSWVQWFDASEHVDAHTAVPKIDLPNGGYLTADPHSEETYTGISNTAPLATTVQGTQVYDVYDSHGELVGKVDAFTISTADLAGGNTQEVFVTNVIDGSGVGGVDPTIGTGDGDVPSVGSVFNYLNYFNTGVSTVYSAYAADPEHGVATTDPTLLWNAWGTSINSPASFDAVTGFTDGSNLFDKIPFVNGLSITPTGGDIGYTDASENYYTGINGIPNGGLSGNNTDVQSFQHFDITNSDGSATPFSAYVTDFGNGSVTAESMFIHDIGANDYGLQDGSTIEYADHGWFSTLAIDSNPTGLGDGANEVTQMLSIPLLGGAWTDIDPSQDFWLSLIGITF